MIIILSGVIYKNWSKSPDGSQKSELKTIPSGENNKKALISEFNCSFPASFV